MRPDKTVLCHRALSRWLYGRGLFISVVLPLLNFVNITSLKKSARSYESACRFLAPAHNALLGCGGEFRSVLLKQPFPALRYSKRFSLPLLACSSLNLQPASVQEEGKGEKGARCLLLMGWRRAICPLPPSFPIRVQLRCQENPAGHSVWHHV